MWLQMKFDDYQRLALRSDKSPATSDHPADVARLIPFLGLAGEAGQLLSEYKKLLRDGPSHVQFVERVSEELGDILWYLSNLASKYRLSLSDIAEQNLKKTADLYGDIHREAFFDEGYGQDEQLPRHFAVKFKSIVDGTSARVFIEIDNRQIGASLTDNAYEDDGYRFHDVFHIAYAAILGWSPVLRGLLRLKRRSTPLIDEVEDGGRAAVIEEGVAAVIFDYARRHQFLDGVVDVDESLIATVRGMSAHLEVSKQPPSVWREAIIAGFNVWRELIKNDGGSVIADLEKGQIYYLADHESAIATAAADKAE
jgi:NTP pyrophosphatase (non-canonical NTP hydrolase)